MATSSRPQPSTIYPAAVPIEGIDSVYTISISAKSGINKKVRQCLSTFQIPSATTTAAAATAATPRTDKRTNNLKKVSPKIIALRADHPSAGSKAITIAEIVKRCIADAKTNEKKNGDNSKSNVWWQYNKLESKLIELPSQTQTGTKAKNVKKKYKEIYKANEKGIGEPGPNTNANKRKQNGWDNRAFKKPKLDSSQSRNVNFQPDDTDKSSADEGKARQHSRGNRNSQSDGSVSSHLRSIADNMNTNDIPRHLRSSSPENVPPHLKSSSPELYSDSKPEFLRDSSSADEDSNIESNDIPPPHLRSSSPENVPPHLKSSSPELYSDSKPEFLRDSSSADEDSNIESNDIPPYLRDSPPLISQDELSTTKPEPTRQESGPMIASSPPIRTVDIPKQAQHSNKDLKSDSTDDDEYYQFSYLDSEHLSKKHPKRNLENVDEIDRNRKKYRAIAILTIYLSLERRGDLEKLYGEQTNVDEKRKEQGKKMEAGK